MIKAIFMDLGKVLIDFDLDVAVRGLENATTWPLSDIKLFLSGELIRDYELGRISTPDFYRVFCEKLGIVIPVEEFRELWSKMFLAEPLLSEPFLQSLRRNYPLHLLSNTNELHYEFVRDRYPILKLFEKRILSYQVGRMKPQPEIYQLAVDQSGVRAEEIFFADDRPENVEAALRLGIQAVRFLNETQLRQDMERMGVVI
jgi:putative hydrolase of the HAD superfamily